MKRDNAPKPDAFKSQKNKIKPQELTEVKEKPEQEKEPEKVDTE